MGKNLGIYMSFSNSVVFNRFRKKPTDEEIEKLVIEVSELIDMYSDRFVKHILDDNKRIISENFSIFIITGHSPNTITRYMQLFRELVVSTLEDKESAIGGKDVIVEIDESKFG
ncbi:219_t:CDS:2, partial [Acaulospora colombiana]